VALTTKSTGGNFSQQRSFPPNVILPLYRRFNPRSQTTPDRIPGASGTNRPGSQDKAFLLSFSNMAFGVSGLLHLAQYVVVAGIAQILPRNYYLSPRRQVPKVERTCLSKVDFLPARITDSGEQVKTGSSLMIVPSWFVVNPSA
jgi:hypothetical protein